MKKLYLIRGVSGSGKTTLAKSMEQGMRYSRAVAADDYFMFEGKYIFDVNKLHAAHQWCQDQVDGLMICEMHHIIVHNTFTTEKEMKPYLNLAEKYGYEVTTLVVENRHESESVHDVPEETLTRQRQRLRANIRL
ncbi:hypothetical protein JAVIER_167 [Vibrio phage Javier]|nr:hypothetical protein JAVIER_167 [Vibrio phage Javier]